MSPLGIRVARTPRGLLYRIGHAPSPLGWPPREALVGPGNTFRVLLEGGEINERQYRGLRYVREHGTIARREYVALTRVSERTALTDLTDLVRKGLLEPTGGRGWRTAYRVRGQTG